MWFQDKAFRRGLVFMSQARTRFTKYVTSDCGNRSSQSPTALLVSTAPRGSVKPLRVLSLGRIHHKKGLDTLLAAWARLPADLRHWHLDIVGPEDGDYGRVVLRNLISELRLRNVSIRGPVYGDDKLALMSASDIFVLPSRNENFGDGGRKPDVGSACYFYERHALGGAARSQLRPMG